MALYLHSSDCVCRVTYMRVLFGQLDKYHKTADLYCRLAVGV